MRRSYLGKNHLHWCDACHTPVLGKICACGQKTREVPITPPGDVRPAFQADIDHINSIYIDQFGVPLVPPGHLVLLNKVPDVDRMEEIIMGGAVVAAIRYIPDTKKWEILPRPDTLLFATPTKRIVTADEGALQSIRNGSSLLAPGLIAIDDTVEPGDEVFMITPSGACAGVGRAKVSASEGREMERGQIVRTRKLKPSVCTFGEATWEEAVEANEIILARVEEEAVGFSRNVTEGNNLQPTVSYSGGKDSLATLLIVLKAIGPVPLLFTDTGLEFPETYENIDTICEHYGLEVIRTDCGEAFAEKLREEGPPAVDLRWCCKVCKLLPVQGLIKERWGEALSYIGQRKYESYSRMKSPRTWRNNIVKVQVSAAPIQHWTALHVFLYLFREKAPYNVLYERRIDRIGCYMCPSSDLASFEIIREQYPELMAKWDAVLRDWQQEHDLPEEWITTAAWRKRGIETDQRR